jgi:hypothetical protein
MLRECRKREYELHNPLDIAGNITPPDFRSLPNKPFPKKTNKIRKESFLVF